MTQDSQENLLMAYRVALVDKQDGIANLLEKVILAEMGSSAYIPVTRGIKVGDESLEPPWKATCGPDMLPRGVGMTVTTDHLGKEETI